MLSQSEQAIELVVSRALPSRACAWAARPAPSPLLVSCAGRDAAGDALVADLRARGLPTRGVVRCAAGATAAVSIIFGRSGEVGCRSPTHALGHLVLPRVWRCPTSLRLTEGAPAATPAAAGTKVGFMVWCAGGRGRPSGSGSRQSLVWPFTVHAQISDEHATQTHVQRCSSLPVSTSAGVGSRRRCGGPGAAADAGGAAAAIRAGHCSRAARHRGRKPCSRGA